MEAKSNLETIHEENANGNGNHAINDHGWQKVTYQKRQRKSQPSKQSTDRDPMKPRSEADLDRSSVFRSLEQHAEERIRLRTLLESEKAAAADAVARSKPSAAASDEEGGDSEAENGGDAGNKTEAKKPKQKKPKKPKITVAEAAAKIDASDLAAFLVEISVCFCNLFPFYFDSCRLNFLCVLMYSDACCVWKGGKDLFSGKLGRVWIQ